MEPFPSLTVPTIPAPAEDGSVKLTSEQLAELLILIDQVLLYVRTNLESCARETNVPGSP
jgi:hypothetical protein